MARRSSAVRGDIAARTKLFRGAKGKATAEELKELPAANVAVSEAGDVDPGKRPRTALPHPPKAVRSLEVPEEEKPSKPLSRPEAQERTKLAAHGPFWHIMRLR